MNFERFEGKLEKYVLKKKIFCSAFKIHISLNSGVVDDFTFFHII